MKYRRHKGYAIVMTVILVVSSLIGLAGGCAGTPVFIPEAIQLEPGPIMVTADQLCQEYLADEAAADAKYKGKEVWVIEAKVDTFLESESGCYFMIRWIVPEPLRIGDYLAVASSYSLSAIKLEPQFSGGFKDVGGGYEAEIVGECQGISEGIITVKLRRVTKSAESISPQKVPEW